MCLVAYTVAGTFGYLTFGSNVPSDILQAYDASQPHVLVAIVALAAKSCATYPILAFCGRSVSRHFQIKTLHIIFTYLQQGSADEFRAGLWVGTVG